MILPGESYRSRKPIFIGLLATLCMLWVSLAASAQGYVQFNYDSLVRVTGQNAFWQDANLFVPWGIAFSSAGPIWISNAFSGTSTVYNGKNLGFRFPSQNQLIVTVPPGAATPAGSKGSPTGIVFNDTRDFVLSQNGASGKAFFIFATLDGTISGWSPAANPSTAIIAVDNSALGAQYTGLALASNSARNFLYAANSLGTIDVFDKNFAPAALVSGSFTDPGLPPLFVPFNIQKINGMLYVTYSPPLGSFITGGIVDIFDTDGNFIQRFATNGTLNSPWGLALAPANFGQFSNDLLVGNLGDGRINAFDPSSGNFLGQLADRNGNPIAIQNLWGLAFGNDGLAGRSNYLLFTAGSNGGLFGSLHALGQ
jgi:uncharacterized protein (TIGR03118 family)